MGPVKQTRAGGFIVLALALFVVLAWVNLFWGELNQDEGWYLYAARQVAAGRRPYRDFAFTQGPALPAVYALADPLIQRGGVGAGRALTAILGLISVALYARVAGRLAPASAAPAARAAAWLLGAVNVYQSYFTTVVKTYALCNLFLSIGFLCLSAAHGRRAVLWAAAAGSALALAVATRLSAAAALCAAGLWLLLRSRHDGPRRIMAYGTGALAALALSFGPAWWQAREGLLFGLIEYHAGRTAGGTWAAAAFRAGFFSRMTLAYWPAVAAALILLTFRGIKSWRWSAPDAPSGTPLLWAAGAMTAVHAAAPFPYDDYQVIVYPVFVAALAAALARADSENPPAFHPRPLLRALALVCAISAFASPVNQQWVILRRDRIWWRTKSAPDLIVLQRAARWLRERMPPGSELMTQDAYLAVEARARLTPRFELGPFSYFPDMPRTRAERLKVLNRELLEEALTRGSARWAAFSGYGLSIASPGIVELSASEKARLQALLEQRYSLVAIFSDFGQAHTELRIYERSD